MVGALKALGIKLEERWEVGEMTVHGCGGRFPAAGGELFLGNAGTAMRPLTAAVAAAGRGKFVLDGVARMRERPIADLVDGLKQLGVDAECTMGTGCPPVAVNAAGLPSGKARPTPRAPRPPLRTLPSLPCRHLSPRSPPPSSPSSSCSSPKPSPSPPPTLPFNPQTLKPSNPHHRPYRCRCPAPSAPSTSPRC